MIAAPTRAMRSHRNLWTSGKAAVTIAVLENADAPSGKLALVIKKPATAIVTA